MSNEIKTDEKDVSREKFWHVPNPDPAALVMYHHCKREKIHLTELFKFLGIGEAFELVEQFTAISGPVLHHRLCDFMAEYCRQQGIVLFKFIERHHAELARIEAASTRDGNRPYLSEEDEDATIIIEDGQVKDA